MDYKEYFQNFVECFEEEHGREPTFEETQDWYGNLVDNMCDCYEL